MDNRTFIIAEMACSHEGQVALARDIIKGAGDAGADAIQFQIWRAADMVVPQHPDFASLQKIELQHSDWRDLADYVRTEFPAMEIIACVYDRFSADFAENLGVDAYKLHSADLSNPHLVRHVAKAGKRIDLSVGGSTLDEIKQALEWIQDVDAELRVWLMYGYQNFPTRTDDVHLRYMIKLRELFELPIGYQDHSAGGSGAAFWLPAAAVGMGVDVLEKHITHDRSYQGIDHQAALNPDEFATFVEMVREIERARGVPVPRRFSADELRYRAYKKSIVAGADLESGAQLEESDLLFMRATAQGLPADQVARLVGRRVKHAVPAYQILTEDDLA